MHKPSARWCCCYPWQHVKIEVCSFHFQFWVCAVLHHTTFQPVVCCTYYNSPTRLNSSRKIATSLTLYTSWALSCNTMSSSRVWWRGSMGEGDGWLEDLPHCSLVCKERAYTMHHARCFTTEGCIAGLLLLSMPRLLGCGPCAYKGKAAVKLHVMWLWQQHHCRALTVLWLGQEDVEWWTYAT